ncbi:hypothetical protein SCH01S_03_00720 [Sphingomonas changbaiensis NBRC 104936]|uniref:Dyp-type peroxidase C-terminal domain-containing protein n=1 Tax=Sphingomonas changbaiensis NBRC 104936 TaxID=1219043 RepID=A0A0E9MJX1_9SPHN|nr:Dyp-type peroxidase domain-containing protein [Sphingomonas changbaiensis]GAO38097.1 hypothetical protein SCH01S_03_00720 [Sphingomonas changbaiensis NBRC 104936]
MPREIASKHLNAISDLVVWAPLKSGFVDSLESVTYESRLKIVAEALFGARSTVCEYQLIVPFSDVSSRIKALQSYRIAVPHAEPRSLLLAATFDRAWEPYMRLIWKPLGPLLDLLFCNCEGYPLATEKSFETYTRWVRDHQVDTDFFFSMNGLSVSDSQYLSQIEQLHRERPHTEASATELISHDPELLAAKARAADPAESSRIAQEALVVLYRLTDFYRPGTPDGKVLLRAAQYLLEEWKPDTPPIQWQDYFKDELAWFKTPKKKPKKVKERLTLSSARKNIQGGILESFGNSDAPPNHGCLLLLRTTDRDKVRGLLEELKPELCSADAQGSAKPDGIFVNLGLTRRGLENLGIPDRVLSQFPKEFREGMEKRAGLLGDVRESHPRRWKLPRQNWPVWRAGDPPRPPVDLSEVDFVVQLRVRSDHSGWDITADGDRHPLWSKVNAIAELAAANGAQLLSVETMRRATDGPDPGPEHFGFLDGISQPRVRTGEVEKSPDIIAAGDVLWGYCNGRHDPPAEENQLLDNGSFVAVRKLRQDVEKFRTSMDEKATALGIPADELMGKIMGRQPDGAPMVAPGRGAHNEFDYAGDPEGRLCPFQAHIRRANPRADTDGGPVPRIIRRGMSYGPPSGDTSAEASAQERGTLFMAHCASLAEQYEVIQRWINGGNSTGVGSVQNDPLMGAGQSGQKRVFRFQSSGGVVRLEVGDPLVSVQWGIYLFVPSLPAIKLMARGWNDTEDDAERKRGNKLIKSLLALPEADQAPRWKACMEDFTSKDPAERGDAPAVWAAIRADHGGALRVPYGTVQDGRIPHAVLVASGELVEKVLTEDQTYSMQGQDERMGKSFGHIYLGLDAGKEYWAKSTGPNAVVSSISEQDAFAVAHQASSAILTQVFDLYAALDGVRSGKFDLRRDYITPALAAVSKYWFGFPDGPPPSYPPQKPPANCAIAWGGWSWSQEFEQKPHCPGYFTSPSRYCFFPDPGKTVEEFGIKHGQALHAVARDYFKQARLPTSPAPVAPIAAALFQQIGDDDELARTLVGIMIGFLPPTEGNLRLSLFEWLDEKILWRAQRALLTSAETDPFKRADATIRVPLMQAMQKRPAPETLWRLAVQKADLNGASVDEGDIIIAGLVSATMEDAARGDVNVTPVFGGDRSAPTHPVHACPGQKFAMGTMLGILSALLECGRIEAMPAPLIVRLTDWSALPAGRP